MMVLLVSMGFVRQEWAMIVALFLVPAYPVVVVPALGPLLEYYEDE